MGCLLMSTSPRRQPTRPVRLSFTAHQALSLTAVKPTCAIAARRAVAAARLAGLAPIFKDLITRQRLVQKDSLLFLHTLLDLEATAMFCQVLAKLTGLYVINSDSKMSRRSSCGTAAADSPINVPFWLPTNTTALAPTFHIKPPRRRHAI